MNEVRVLSDRLNKQKKLRVWSVIISFFGDSILPRGGVVSAKTVQTVLGQMGIEHGTVRTAFSRLSGDGWVQRMKQGRESFYLLSSPGKQLFVDATSKIYAPIQRTPRRCATWTLSIDGAGKIHLHGSGSLGTEELADSSENLIMSGELVNCPTWVKDLYAPKQTAQAYSNLIENFSVIDPEKLSPLDAVASRCLLIHEWRKIILANGYLDIALQPDEWPQNRCHEFVSQFYKDCSPIANEWLNTQATGPEGNLPPPDNAVEKRFV